jgi:L-amino acid N-acyltransferase YncA
MVHKTKSKSLMGIYEELMKNSKSFRESTPRTRETRVKRLHTLRMKKG